MRQLVRCVAAAGLALAAVAITTQTATAEDLLPLTTDSNGNFAAVRPGYFMGFIDGVAKSNARQPIRFTKDGFVVGKLPKQPGYVQGRWRLNGSDALGHPNALTKKRFINVRSGGYVTFSATGFDPNATVSAYLISNTSPLVATLLKSTYTTAQGEVNDVTSELPIAPVGNATIELVGTRGGHTVVLTVGVRNRNEMRNEN